MKEPVLCLVGRPNVGKSTLFNRIIGKRLALVENSPGVTRDRHYAPADHLGRRFLLVDTGGFDPHDDSGVFSAVRKQCLAAIQEADLIVHVLDARSGATPDDADIVTMLRRSKKPVLWAASKVDTQAHEALASEFYELGIPEVFPVSGVHGLGVAELLDEAIHQLEALHDDLAPLEDEQIEKRERFVIRATQRPFPDHGVDGDGLGDEGFDGDVLGDEGFDDEGLDDERLDDEGLDDQRLAEPESGGPGDPDGPETTPAPSAEPQKMPPIRVALIGRPNAGKSSLMNRLLGEDRSVVHNAPGTTRDPVDVPFEVDGQEFILVDTAGIRRRKYVKEGMELVAVIQAVRALERAHVVCLVCDSELGLTEQDAKLASLAEDRGRAMVVLLNKWDTVRDPRTRKELERDRDRKLRFVSHCPMIKVSALTGKNTQKIPGEVTKVFREAHTRVPTSWLNRFLAQMVERRPPAAYMGKQVRLYYMTQAQVNPPTFLVYVSHPKGITKPYRRFLANRLREVFGFHGTALRLVVKPHRDRPSRKRKRKPKIEKGTSRKRKARRGRR